MLLSQHVFTLLCYLNLNLMNRSPFIKIFSMLSLPKYIIDNGLKYKLRVLVKIKRDESVTLQKS